MSYRNAWLGDVAPADGCSCFGCLAVLFLGAIAVSALRLAGLI